MIRVGLVIYNREIPEQFPGDPAMQAGTWWPGYTPAYITLLRLGFRLVGDLEIFLLLLTGLAYTSLLCGFYVLGRSLGLPFGAALLLMLLSGLYQTAALGSAWTGVRLEMAAARNLYLALLPWLLRWGMTFIPHALTGTIASPPQTTMAWAKAGLYGFTLGLLANLHSINGIFTLAIVGGLMLIGVLLRRFRLRDVLIFGIAALPGVALVYLTTYSVYAGIVTEAVAPEQVYGYTDLTKANLLFYRPPNWSLPIVLYTLLTVISGGRLLWRWHAPSAQKNDLWYLVFGLTQIGGALLLLTADWLILFAGGGWLLAARRGQDQTLDRWALLLLLVIAVLALPLGSTLYTLASTGIFPAAGVFSRALERGGTFAYAAVILLTVNGLWRMLAPMPRAERLLYLAVALAALANGMIQSYVLLPLEGIAYAPTLQHFGQLLPVDVWTYLGVGLLLIWPAVKGKFAVLRFGVAAALLVIASSRVLAAPAPDATAVLIGIWAGGVWSIAKRSNAKHNTFTQEQRLTPHPLQLPYKVLVVLAGLLLIVLLTLPIGGRSILGGLISDTPRALARNWSFTDHLSNLSLTYRTGDWLRQNTPPESVIIFGNSYLRYWARRPLAVGGEDAGFLLHDPAVYPHIAAEYERLRAAYADPVTLLAFAQDYDADYIVAPLALGLDTQQDATLVYVDDAIGIYTIFKP